MWVEEWCPGDVLLFTVWDKDIPLPLSCSRSRPPHAVSAQNHGGILGARDGPCWIVAEMEARVCLCLSEAVVVGDEGGMPD